MGDSIIGLGAIQYLKKIIPNSRITYGLPSWIIPLYSKVKTSANDFLNIDFKNPEDLIRLYKDLFNKKYDLVFELHQSKRTGRFYGLNSKIFNYSYYYHNHHRQADESSFVRDQGQKKPIIQRDLDGIWGGLSDYTEETLNVPNYLNFYPQMKLSDDHVGSNKIIFGVTGTRWTKLWPLENYFELAKQILTLKSSIEILIPLSNSKMDQIIENKLNSLGLPPQCKIIKRPLDELPTIVEGAKFYVGNDTGLKHLCIALGMKTFSFFGPEEPMEWHPYDRSKHHYFFIDNLECRTRISHYCPLNECDSMICLKDITPISVLENIKSQLK